MCGPRGKDFRMGEKQFCNRNFWKCILQLVDCIQHAQLSLKGGGGCAAHVPPRCRGGRRSVSEYKKGFHAELTHYVKKQTELETSKDPRGIPESPQPFPQAPLEGKDVVFDTQCTIKWSPKGLSRKKKRKKCEQRAKNDPKLSKNWATERPGAPKTTRI